MICPHCGHTIEHDCSHMIAIKTGQLGGRVKSERKTAACRLNARKGGWPQGKPRKPKP